MYLRINIEHQAYFGRVIFFNKGKTFCGVAAFQLSYGKNGSVRTYEPKVILYIEKYT